MWPRVIAMIEKGKLRVERIVTARIGADDVVEKGFRTLLHPAGNQMKGHGPGRVTKARRSYPRPEMRRCRASSKTAASNDRAGGEALPEDFDAGEIWEIAGKRDDDYANDRTQDLALAAIQAGAADDDGRDHLELQSFACVRRYGPEA